MRLLFEKGKQKEFILTFKQVTKLTWKEISKLIRYSRRTIDDWRKEKATLPEEIFKIFIEKVPNLKAYEKYILKKKSNNWGQKKGALLTNKIQGVKIKHPKKSQKLAELVGIILGDGNLYTNKKRGVYELRIFGHSIDDKEYLLKFVKPLVDKLFKVNSKIYKVKNKKCSYIKIQSRRIIDYFRSNHSLIPGNKIKNNLQIPSWIFEKNSYLKACIRGLIDTDGCAYTLKPHYPHLYQIYFISHNKKLLNQAILILKKLGFHPSRISYNKTYITKKQDIKKFLKEIGFSNPKHSTKFNSPVV